MSEVVPEAIGPAAIEGADRGRSAYAGAADARSARRWPSVGLHATLIIASLIAMLPDDLGGARPRSSRAPRIQSTDLELVEQPDARQLHGTCCTETNFPRWFLNSVIVAAPSRC